MASTFNVVYGAIVALAFWTLLGFVITRRIVAPGLALPFAPVAGWAVHSVVALLIFFVIPFTTINVAIVAALLFVICFVATRGRGVPEEGIADHAARVPAWAYLFAMLLAVACAAALLPKVVGDTVILSGPIFDHAKAALVDDMIRLGLPPGNPFLGRDGGPDRIAYYYLWHFSAAEVGRLLHVTGWEAEAAMTFVSAFASLAAMMGLAVRFSGRPKAALWVVVFALSASTRFVLVSLFGEPGLDAWIQNPGGFAGWFFQTPWVPQHLMATSCVLLSVYLMTRLATRLHVPTLLVMALSIAAAFESSTWIGGVVFALASVVVVPILIAQTESSKRWRLIAALSIAAIVAIVIAWPFLRDQLVASAERKSGAPIAFKPFEILGERIPPSLRRALDPLAYWLILLPIELMAIHLPGLAGMIRALKATTASSSERRIVVAFAALGIASLAVAGLFTSTLADNNDLAWRAVLLASTALIVFAAAGLASWIADRRRTAVALTLLAIALGLPEAGRLIHGNFAGHPQPGARSFALAPELWSKVREYAGLRERVANNPLALDHMTPWPDNIGWSLLSDRRSCYATWELTQVYTSLPHDRLKAIDNQFVRVFAGDGSADDVRELAGIYDCRVVVITPDDGAWNKDPFKDSGFYRLVDEKEARWRIYRRRDAADAGP